MLVRSAKSRGLLVVLLGVPLLLALYVASIGPAGKIVPPIRPSLGQPFGSHYWESTYAPLLWTTDRSQTAAKVASWYLRAWGADGAADLILVRSFSRLIEDNP